MICIRICVLRRWKNHIIILNWFSFFNLLLIGMLIEILFFVLNGRHRSNLCLLHIHNISSRFSFLLCLKILKDVLRLKKHSIVSRCLRNVLSVGLVMKIRAVADTSPCQLVNVTPLGLAGKDLGIRDLQTVIEFLFFLHNLSVFIKIYWGMWTIWLEMIFLSCNTLKRLGACVYLRVVTWVKLRWFDVTLNGQITILDYYGTFICQLRFFSTLPRRTPLLACCLSCRLLILCFIRELNHLIVCAGRRDIDGCGACLVGEHRVCITLISHVAIVRYHDLRSSTRCSIQVSTAID